MKITIEETGRGWKIDQEDDDNTWPTTYKETRKEAAARVLQLLDLGPTAPQASPEMVTLTK